MSIPIRITPAAAPAPLRSAVLTRVAGDGFHSELYLDQPLETLIASRTGEEIARESLVEIEVVAIGRPGRVRHLVDEIVDRLSSQGVRRAVLIADTRSRVLARWVGLPHVELGRIGPPEADYADRREHDPGRYLLLIDDPAANGHAGEARRA